MTLTTLDITCEASSYEMEGLLHTEIEATLDDRDNNPIASLKYVTPTNGDVFCADLADNHSGGFLKAFENLEEFADLYADHLEGWDYAFCYIDKIEVSEAWRGQGVGSELLNFLEKCMLSNCHGLVILESVDSAIGWYEHRGWVRMEDTNTMAKFFG